jgi:aryl-alcohol dehydrogenase-like predicted oxidoreductase
LAVLLIKFLKNKIVIGTAQFGMHYGIANKKGKVHSNEVASILDFAFKNNISALDTAKIYGNSERVIGDYLKTRPKCSWDVITKFNHINVANQLQDSTEKLNSQPTMILAHSVNLFLDPVFQLELQEAKDKKMVRSIGVSLYNEIEINQVLEAKLKPEVVQLPMNILDTRLYRNKALNNLIEKGVEIHVRSAFLQGLFYLSTSDLQKRFGDVVPQLEILKSIAAKVDLTLAELSLLWLVNLKEVSKVIIGVDNINQLKRHLRALKKKIDSAIFNEALCVQYENEKILNPSLWPVKS